MTTANSNLIDLRHWLHAHPELSNLEEGSAAKIRSFLEACLPGSVTENIGGHGLIARFDSGRPGPVILFRSETDALPIEETNDFKHRSLTKGVSHKCGHDGHATILCGLARMLSEQPPPSGTVLLLFQPAEETGEGAERVFNDPMFSIKPDYVFALHNLPGFPTGEVILKEGLFSAAVNSIIFHLGGKTAHAAEPESGINPAGAVSKILALAESLNHNIPGDPDFRLVTPVHGLLGGKAYGTAAGYGELHFTLRAWGNEPLEKLEKTLIEKSRKIAREYGLEFSWSFRERFYANNNDPGAIQIVRQVADRLGYPVREQDEPFKWGEDFGYFTSRFKGCMFGLGAGEQTPALHNPDYDFPDTLIGPGVNLFFGIANHLLT